MRRPTVVLPFPFRVALLTVLSCLVSGTPLLAQYGIVSITPSSGSFPVGSQYVTVSYCAVSGGYPYSDSHSMTFNGNDVTGDFSLIGYYDPSCTWYQEYGGYVTIASGSNSFFASFAMVWWDLADQFWEVGGTNNASYTGYVPDQTLPTITLVAPSGPITAEYPTITLEWCDNVSLNASSRYIYINSNLVTSAFSYTTLSGSGCGAARAQSTTTSVAIPWGNSLVQAYICDDSANCKVEYDTIQRGTQGAPVIALRNFNGENQNRAWCLTAGAGQAAGLSCGDLFVDHGMPAYATMGRDRSLSLFYNSASAAPRPAVAVTVTEPVATLPPSSVYAELRISGVLRASGTFTGFANSTPRQIVLAYDAKDDPSGLYDYTLLVRNQYGGASYDATLAGSVIVANRSASEFGAGWWLEGVEQLVLGQSGNRILWLGGEGSAAVYYSIGTNVWQRAAGEFRDSLVYDPGTQRYTRTIEHGVQVVFDVAGRHVQTVNRVGQMSQFTWGAPPGYGSYVRLLSISVPPGGVSGNTYTLAYTGSLQLVNTITDPAGRVLDPNVGTYLYGTKYGVTSITDPDGYAVQFTYDGAGRMTARRTRRGYWTSFSYTGQLHVDSARVPVGSAPGDTAITRFVWWDERSLAFNLAGGSIAATDTTQASTQIFGPRRNASDDATFFVDRFGAPTRITDPIGAQTIVTRGDAAVPALPTEVRYHDGRIARLFWNARGNLDSTRDSTSHLGVAGQPTAVDRWYYNSSSTKDSPSQFVNGEGVPTSYQYNSWGLASQVTSSSGHVTTFEFVPSGPLTGLLNAVTEVSVAVYDSVANARITTNLRHAFGFNALGNVVADTSPAGRVRTYSRDGAQRVYETLDPAGVKSTISYDPLNRRTRTGQYIEGGDSLLTNYSYDIDVLTQISDPRSVVRTYQYDFADRQIGETDDFSRQEQRWFSLAGQVDSVWPRYFRHTPGYPASAKVRNYFDQAGRLTRTAWPARELLYADSNLFTYDTMGRMLTAERVSTSNQSGWRTTRTYFANGTVRTDQQSRPGYAASQRLEYSYDRAGRRTWYRVGVTGSLTQSDSVWYSYQAATGDLTAIGVRWRGTAQVKDSVRFTWDELGRRSQLLYTNNARVTFVYDRDGAARFVCGVHSGGASDDVYDFTVFHSWIDTRGLTRRTTNYTPAGWTADCSSNQLMLNTYTMTYDMRGQLLTQQAVGNNHTYEYDASGNMTRDNETSPLIRNRVMVMSAAHNRLTQWHYSNNPSAGNSYVYDAGANRVQQLPFPTQSSMGRRDIWYDGLGRTTGTSEYKCNDESCSQPQWVYEHTVCSYDGLGRLIFPCENLAGELGYDGNNVIRTGPDDSDWGWTFVHGPGTDDPIMAHHRGYNKRWYYITDGQGRQYAVGDLDGYNQLTEPYYNEPHMGGKYAGGTRNAATFGASRSPNYQMVKVSFFRNRFYDQETGRWMQEDPIGVAGGINLYGYVGNNPVTFTDPFGLEPCKDDDLLCQIARAGWQLVGASVGLVAGGAGGAVIGTIACGPPHCTVAGIVAGAVAGSVAGAAVAGQVFDNTSQMASAGKGRGGNRVPNADVLRIVREQNLNPAGRQALHREISGRDLTLEEIREIAARLAQQAKYRNPPSR